MRFKPGQIWVVKDGRRWHGDHTGSVLTCEQVSPDGYTGTFRFITRPSHLVELHKSDIFQIDGSYETTRILAELELVGSINERATG
jgi:hypothetical protein